ncbi:MAG: TetR family transcriptional regulator [Solirubrobacterales bacterium]|nr:TetR family transcriptional regulator [Solirubrobacterales bacterium]
MPRTSADTDRRSEILAAAARCFDASGYHNTTIDDIAAAVGVSKPTVYYYFRSKHELLYLIHDEMLDLVLSRHEARAREGFASHSAALEGLMRDVVALTETHPGHLLISFEHYRELSREFKPRIRAKRDRFRSIVREVVRSGMESGEFIVQDVEMTTLAVLGMCNWTYQWLRPESRTAAEVAESFWRFTMRSIAVDPVAQGAV